MIGMNLKYLRKKYGYSQEDLAEKLEVSRQSVAKWENGVNSPRTDKIPEIAKALNCEISDLFKREN